MRTDITPVVLTFNEEANIVRTLDGVAWAKDIVIVDSFSTDATLRLAAAFPQVRVFQRPFDEHAKQWNFGIHETGITTDWVLALDADYVVTDEAAAEVDRLDLAGPICGYRASFVYCVNGRRLRGALYTDATLLFRRKLAAYAQYGHTQRVLVEGPVARLSAKLLHDDRKPLARWFLSQQRYAALEAEYLVGTDKRDLRRTDALRLMAWPAPILVFFYTLIFKGCLLDGWAGWIYVLQRTCAELMIALEILERTRVAP